MIFTQGTPRQRADRVLDLLTLFDDRDACQSHAEEAAWASDPERAALAEEHAALITILRDAAEAQSLSDTATLPERLTANATCLEEALGVLAAAVRDQVPYAVAVPDWRRPFLDTLPQDGSFRAASACAAETEPLPAPSEGRVLALTAAVSLMSLGGRHWVLNGGQTVCGPGRTAIRVAPAEHRGRGYGALHCAAERLLNLSDPQSQPSLTPGGYASRSGAWDLLAAEARDLGLPVAEKGPVPAFDDLEGVLNGVEDRCGVWG